MPPRKAPQPWEPAPYDDDGVITASIKALVAGNANEDQQRRALDWIVRHVCGTYDLSFRPESERASAFAEGKRYVGLQIIKHMKLTTSGRKPGPTKRTA